MNGIIQSEDFYVWDNWGFIDEGGVWHIYAQYCDRSLCEEPEDRYWNAHIEHFTSADQGQTFQHEGPSIEKSLEEKDFDSYNIWSGCAYPLSNGRILGLYTGLQMPDHSLQNFLEKNNRKFALQSIGVAISEDGGYTFIKNEKPLISPILHHQELLEKGYYLGDLETLGAIDDPDGTFMCLRDPEVLQEEEQIHVFFGAKATINMAGHEVIRNAVGHAILRSFRDEQGNFEDVTIQKPLFIAKENDYNQLELPNVVKWEGTYYLIVSTTKIDYIGQSDMDVDKTVRIYKSNQLIDGEWEPYGNEGRHIVLSNKIHRLYGPKVLHQKNASNIVLLRPFVVGEPYAPPTIQLDLSGNEPRLIF